MCALHHSTSCLPALCFVPACFPLFLARALGWPSDKVDGMRSSHRVVPSTRSTRWFSSGSRSLCYYMFFCVHLSTPARRTIYLLLYVSAGPRLDLKRAKFLPATCVAMCSTIGSMPQALALCLRLHAAGTSISQSVGLFGMGFVDRTLVEVPSCFAASFIVLPSVPSRARLAKRLLGAHAQAPYQPSNLKAHVSSRNWYWLFVCMSVKARGVPMELGEPVYRLVQHPVVAEGGEGGG